MDSQQDLTTGLDTQGNLTELGLQREQKQRNLTTGLDTQGNETELRLQQKQRNMVTQLGLTQENAPEVGLQQGLTQRELTGLDTHGDKA